MVVDDREHTIVTTGRRSHRGASASHQLAAEMNTLNRLIGSPRASLPLSIRTRTRLHLQGTDTLQAQNNLVEEIDIYRQVNMDCFRYSWPPGASKWKHDPLADDGPIVLAMHS
jgi:hypothetical protein